MRKSLIKQLHVTILVEIAVFPFKKIHENKYKAYLEIATLWVKASGPLLPNEIVVNLNNVVDSEVVECEW